MSLLDDLLTNEESRASAPEIPAVVSGAILAVDIGNVYTRVVLLDVVDGQFRFVSRGESPTTDRPPFNDVFEGVRRAIIEISEATGRTILDERSQLVMPERSEFLGVSLFAATASAGKSIRSVLVGLVPDVSLSSGRRAAESTYMQVVDTFSLADRRSPEKQIEAFLEAEPDTVLIVGGTDGGAADSLRNQVRLVGLAAQLMNPQFQPIVLYAGNRDLAEEVREYLADEIGVRVQVAENVRPALDVERLDSAQAELAALYHHQKASATGGFAEIGNWTPAGVFPTAHGFSRTVHILSELLGEGVLGVDLGSASTSIAASVKGSHYLNVFDELGVGHSAKHLLKQIRVEALTRWLTYEPSSRDEIPNYLFNKSLHPHVVPATTEELEIEYAMVREIVRRAVASARSTWRDVRRRGLLPPFQTILLSGSALTRTPNDGWSALLALDSLLPVGITRLMLDPYGLAPALGSIAPSNPAAVVQVLDTGAFIDLGDVISISGRARQGDVVLHGSVKPEGASSAEPFEVRYGSIVSIPIQAGMRAEVTIQPRGVQIETGSRRFSRRMSITGGELGLVVDARGRPWRFPREPQERRSMLLGWQKTIAGREE